MDSKPLTVRQASEALSLSEHTVRAWITSRRIGIVRLGRAVRIPSTEITRILTAGTVPAREQEGSKALLAGA
jgi:excisionase family DNA binding protein